MLIDSHCHPDGPEYADDREQIFERARAAGVTGILAIGGGAEPGTLDCGLQVAGAHEGVWASAGIHPHEARCASDESFRELEKLCADAQIIAVGEIGLDFHYDHSPQDVQRQVFRRQLALARDLDLPVSIHCREAWQECFQEIERVRVAGVFHCFTGTAADAQRALDLGFYLSFSGMLTFPKADSLRQIAAGAPADRILTETDAPYLAPVPHRGKRNEPAWVTEVARTLAALRGWTFEEAGRRTAENFFRLFPRAADGARAR